MKIYDLRYSLLFLFDNVVSHPIYTKQKFQVQKINKNIRIIKYNCVINSLKKTKFGLSNL